MSQLWTPESVRADQARERFVDAQLGQAKYWDKLLKEIDPSLSLVFISEHANEPGLVPGRWHIRRKPPVGMAWYWPITTETGGYREMHANDLEALKAGDLWDERVARDRKAQAEKIRKAKQRALENEREGLKENAVAEVRAAKRVSGDGGLSRRRWGKG